MIDITDIEAVCAEMARRDAAKRSLTCPGTLLHGLAQAARRRLRRACRALRIDDFVLQEAVKVRPRVCLQPIDFCKPFRLAGTVRADLCN